MAQEDGEDQGVEEVAPEPERVSGRRNILGIELPAEVNILREARTLAGDKNTRITNLARTASQDPVITLELLRIANATFFSADRPAISNVQTAVVRLGSQTVVELLDSIGKRPKLEDPIVFDIFESLRSLARRTSIVSRIIAQMTHGDIAELAQTAGLLIHIGHMVACAHLREEYADEALSRRRSALVYRILQDHQFDINRVGLDYLRNHGVPHVLFYGLDRDLKCKTPSQSALRFIIESAVELVDAHHEGKWEKYAPDKPFPGKSALRLLQMNETQYEHVYETVQSYLEKPETKADDSETKDTALEEFEFEEEDYPEEITLLPEEEAPEEDFAEDISSSHILREEPAVVIKRGGFSRERIPDGPTLVLTEKGFAGYDPTAQPTTFLESNEEEIEEEQQTLSEDAQKVLNLIDYLCRESDNCQTLLGKIMQLLISEGPFVRAALITLKTHRRSANIHTAVGEGFIEDDEISVRDPLSPLALCLTKIKSFNAKDIEDLLAPFGVSSYAVSPIKVVHEAPVVLYADCGLSRPLPLEARKIFRLVVGLLNQTLPRLPGGLPKKAVSQSGDTKKFQSPSSSSIPEF